MDRMGVGFLGSDIDRHGEMGFEFWLCDEP
jgi:hypothetical protein